MGSRRCCCFRSCTSSPDEDDPPAIAARFIDPLAPGSYLAISHGSNDNLDGTAVQGAQRYSQRVGGFWLRTREQIAAMFGSLPLVEPGLVDFTAWRPDTPDVVAAAGQMPGYASIARKP